MRCGKEQMLLQTRQGQLYGMKLSNITHNQGRQAEGTNSKETLNMGLRGTPMWRSSGDSLYGSCGLTRSQGNLEVHLQFWEMQTISWGQTEDQWLSGVVVGRQGKSGGKDFKEA